MPLLSVRPGSQRERERVHADRHRCGSPPRRALASQVNQPHHFQFRMLETTPSESGNIWAYSFYHFDTSLLPLRTQLGIVP